MRHRRSASNLRVPSDVLEWLAVPQSAFAKLPRSRSDPFPWQADYVQLTAIRVQLERRINRFWAPGADLDVLDVGCDARPYERMLGPFTARYVGLDIAPGPGVDVVGTAESIPVADATFDCILCTQVLQLVADPASAIREMRRVLRPGGAIFLSAPGTGFVDRKSVDRWRWTQHGLAQVLAHAGPWSDLEIIAAAGVACAAAYLAGGQLEFGAHHFRVPIIAAPFCLALNVVAWNLDRYVRRNFRELPPDAAVNYFVAARRPAA